MLGMSDVYEQIRRNACESIVLKLCKDNLPPTTEEVQKAVTTMKDAFQNNEAFPTGAVLYNAQISYEAIHSMVKKVNEDYSDSGSFGANLCAFADTVLKCTESSSYITPCDFQLRDGVSEHRDDLAIASDLLSTVHHALGCGLGWWMS